MNKKLTRKLVAVLMALTMVMSLFAVSLVSAEDAAPAAQAPAASAQETPAATDESTTKKEDESTTKKDEESTTKKDEETTTQKEEPTTQPTVDPEPEDPQPAPTPALNAEDVYWVKKINKKWVLVANKNSNEQVKETGVFKNENGWWRVEKGVVNFKATGLYQNSFG